MYAKVIVAGNVGKDPEMRYTPNGTPVTTFSVAHNPPPKDGQEQKTVWFTVTCWRKLAEVAAEHVHKGMAVLVDGDIDARVWSDKDGNPRATLQITANTLRFLGGRRDDESEGG